MQPGTTPAPRKRRPVILTPRILSAFPTITDVTGQVLRVDETGVVFQGRLRLREAPTANEVGRAMAILAGAARIRTPSICSYAAKGVLERLSGGYISNGALILAASTLGIRMLWIPNTLNVRFAISRKWYRSLQEAKS